MLAAKSSMAARPAFGRPARRALAVRADLQALKVGDKLSDNSEYYRVLKASDNKAVQLSQTKGKALVLFFYPKAATPGCTKEACAFRDAYARFTDAGATVYGISSDSPAENGAFAKAQNLPYALLTDPNAILRKTFGIKADLMGLLPGRQTYVFDKEGTCLLVFNDQFNPEQHVEKALSAIKASVKA